MKRTIRIDDDVYKWFQKTYDGVSFEWIVNRLLKGLKDQHSTSLFDNPINQITKEVKEEIG